MTMKTSTPILTQIFFVIATAQEPQLRMVIKSFMTIKLAITLDDMFVRSFPHTVKDVINRINADDGQMLMPKENLNSTWIAFERFFNAIKTCMTK